MLRIISLIWFILLIIPVHAQDLIFLTNQSVIECELDTSSLHTNKIMYKRYDREGQYWIKLSRIIFIQNYLGEILYPKEFIVNLDSKMIHWPNAQHIPKSANCAVFPSIAEAKQAGFRTCNACFNEETFLPDIFLERRIGYATNIEFINTHEIIYEDPRLPKIQKLLQQVLKTWPQKAKGYNYRVQIFRGRPNALAIPCGNIYISDELLDLIESDGELLGILAHEISHVEKRHGLRQYYHDQEQASLVFLTGLFAGTLASLAGADQTTTDVIALTTGIFAGIASKLNIAGYSRDLEQEADIMAQLYFHSNNIPNDGLIGILDKLAYFSLIRGSLEIGNEIYSSHPIIKQRIIQVKNSKIHYFDRPINYVAQSSTSTLTSINLAEIKISLLYLFPSSIDRNTTEFFLQGSCQNFDEKKSIRLSNLHLISDYKELQIPIDGLTELLVYRGETKEISFRTSLPSAQVQSIFDQIISGEVFNISGDIATMNIERKGAENKINFCDIPCNFISVFE